jgi:hypothetical protein
VTKTLTITAAVISAALALTACGSSSGSDGKNDIKGTQSGSATPSATASAKPANVKAPKITLPKDVKLVFDGWKSSDPVPNAILTSSAQRVRALNAAEAQGQVDSSALDYYSFTAAQASADKVLKFYKDKGYSITGIFRYFDPRVTVYDKTDGQITYCGDESKGFGKVRETGKVLTTPVTKDSYLLYTALMRKSSNGVWQTADMSTDPGAAQCQP